MTPQKKIFFCRLTFFISSIFFYPGAQAQAVLNVAPGQVLATLRATELRSDKLATARVLTTLNSGSSLQLLSVEGGWALVNVSADKAASPLSGWVRASAVNWQAGPSPVSGLATGRSASGNIALTLGVRSFPPRVNRHALIIGVGRYADAEIAPLPGTRIDKESATQMAQAMQVPASNIRYLQDEQATGENIRLALQQLSDRVVNGDRVFIHFSGHGTRYKDPVSGGCVEALLAHEGGQSGTISNHEMANLLKTITGKTDKLMVMYDACHSGGLVQAAATQRTRSFSNRNDEGLLRPKFAAITEECSRPVNVKTRSLLSETSSQGVLPEDIIHISASRDNEISFDDELKGGLATQYMRDCMLRDAADLDNSGAVSIDEIKQCAQEKINRRMSNDSNYKAHNLVLNGNSSFVPAWFAQAVVTPAAATTVNALATEGQKKESARTNLGLTGEQALRQMFDQRLAKRNVQIASTKPTLKIGVDALDLEVQSDRDGYVYIAMAGSDNQSLYLIFPNDLDPSNKIKAGQKMFLPRPNWRVKAAGPAGTDHLLVMVTDGPRDLSSLASSKTGPFIRSLNDAAGRAALGSLMSTSTMVRTPSCADPSIRQSNPFCSDAYGAAILSLEEIK